ncbi:PEP-CTERM sorting domain-containing protein [Roseateles puraquae]|uniref:PEP-CTERM sorting domain-containing protein n=1 Tax=Roseateles puraquae TaxID=431059 RepID=UPI0031E3C30B
MTVSFNKRLGVATLVALALSAAGLAQAATLDNPGFESGLTGWSITGTVTAESTDVRSGTLAALLADDSSSLSLTLSSAIDAASIASFGFWARSDAGLLSLVVLNYSDGSSSGTDVSIFDLGNSSWTYYDLSSALSAGKSLVGFTLYGSSAAASVIDDVTLTTLTTAVPEPASAALLAAGLGLVGWRQRRSAR